MAYGKDLNQDLESEKTSRINSAGLINSILENLWKNSYTYMANGDYLKWNSTLDAIWSILGGDCKDGDDDDVLYTGLNMKIYGLGTLKSRVGVGFSQKPNPNNSHQYHLLLKKALFLRRLQNKQGKGTAYHSDDDDDFD